MAIGIVVIVAVLLLWFGGRSVLGFARVSAGAVAPPLPASGFSHERLARVLGAYVVDGQVDYAALAAQRVQLQQYVAALEHTGPDSTPERFPDDRARLAYYMNAYNALVLHAVITHWPIGSVHDVHGAIEARAGFGFFYGLSFGLDGGRTNLYDLENDIIRGFGDARIHAAINCASTSCPTLRAAPFEAAGLDAQLDSAMRDFVADPRHVSIAADRIGLSSIFEWYREDFESHAASRLGKGGAGALLDFIAHFLDEERAGHLRAARDAGAEVVFLDYDWGLNRAP